MGAKKIYSKNISKNINKLFNIIILCAFFGSYIIPSDYTFAQGVLAQGSFLGLPKPGSSVSLSLESTPPLLHGIKIYPDNPLQFDFMLDKGDSSISKKDLEEESKKLIHYFLSSLAFPENDVWVNLSPYEDDRIISDSLSTTEMGRDMLAQDYLLKQISASLIDPRTDLGKEFWDKVYQKAFEEFGTTNIPLKTFNKVWIVPHEVTIVEDGDKAYIIESSLKVMMDQDYISMRENLRNDIDQNMSRQEAGEVSSVSSAVMRQVIIPVLEKEVNSGEHFSQLRQITNAWVLATWFKSNLKEAFLNRVYADQKKIKGIDVSDKDAKKKIYKQYLEAFEKGVCNYVKIDYDKHLRKNVPRKYFSGGIEYSSSSITTVERKDLFGEQLEKFRGFMRGTRRFIRRGRVLVLAAIMLAQTTAFSAADMMNSNFGELPSSGMLSPGSGNIEPNREQASMIEIFNMIGYQGVKFNFVSETEAEILEDGQLLGFVKFSVRKSTSSLHGYYLLYNKDKTQMYSVNRGRWIRTTSGNTERFQFGEGENEKYDQSQHLKKILGKAYGVREAYSRESDDENSDKYDPNTKKLLDGFFRLYRERHNIGGG